MAQSSLCSSVVSVTWYTGLGGVFVHVITNRLIQHFPPNHNTHMTTSITKDCMSILPSLFWCNKTDSWVCTCQHACTCTYMYMHTHNTHTYCYTHNVIVVTITTYNHHYATEPLMSVLHYHSKPFEARLKFTIPSSTITCSIYL